MAAILDFDVIVTSDTLDRPSPDFEKEAQAVLTFQDGRHMKKMAANFDEKLDKIYVFVAVWVFLDKVPIFLETTTSVL